MEGDDRHPATKGGKGTPESEKLLSRIIDVLSRNVIGEDGKQPAHLVSSEIRASDHTPLWVLAPFYYRSTRLSGELSSKQFHCVQTHGCSIL